MPVVVRSRTNCTVTTFRVHFANPSFVFSVAKSVAFRGALAAGTASFYRFNAERRKSNENVDTVNLRVPSNSFVWKATIANKGAQKVV